MPDEIDAAIAQAQQEPRMAGQFTLSNGRRVGIDLPIPLSAEEVIELMMRIPGLASEANHRAAGPSLTLPSGQVVPITRRQ